MLKKILSIGLLALTAFGMSAQQPTQLPLDQKVRHGQLPNGLNYYLLHNEEPKERANFYIAQKVGSTLETPEQLGLAHFLEHMAFNGTKNYPGKNMLNYLQSKGIRFGADINAYTAFDETVYNINNVHTADQALMDSVLLCIYDWSCNILLEEDEINAERGVIQEEWRSRNNADQRRYEYMLPRIYSEYQYQQMPIGKMDVVMNFPPQVLRDYYHKWYRPDQQGIVIVGDFDVDAMEKKVKDLFSTVKMPENAAPRDYPSVSDNDKPIYVYFQDKEQQFPLIQVMFKSEKLPFDLRNTDMALQVDVMKNLLSMMINDRLDEYAQKPECKYAQAGVYFSDFMVSKTKDAFTIVVIPKDDVKGAYDEALAIVARACKTGFTPSELERSRDELLSSYEKAYNERNKTNSNSLAKAIIRHFVDNEPYLGAESDYEIAKSLLPQVPVQALNMIAQKIMTPNNQVIVVSQPEKEGMTVISEEEMVGGLNNAMNAEYEAYVDEVITDPLIEKAPKAGKIKSVKAGDFGSTVYTLSNGATVVVKPTDFKADEIRMDAFKEGGKNVYSAADAGSVILAGDAFQLSKVNKFDRVKLGKYLAGKNVGLGYGINRTVTEVEGQSTVKDLPVFMELLYASFTGLNPDNDAYTAQMEQAKTFLRNAEKMPEQIFQKRVSKDMFGNNPLFAEPSVELIEGTDYQKTLNLVNKSLANAADYTFVFTGNIDEATFKPLVEKYIASLPSTGKKSAVKAVTSVSPVKGKVDDHFKQPMQVPSTMVVRRIGDSNIPYNTDNDVYMDLLGDILMDIYTQTLREEEGGTYSPYAGGSFNPSLGEWQVVYQFQTNADQQDKLIKRADDELEKLLKNGADAKAFNKAREAMMKQYENQIRTNGYWQNALVNKLRGKDTATTRKASIEGATLEGLNAFMKNLYNGNNSIVVVMEGTPVAAK